MLDLPKGIGGVVASSPAGSGALLLVTVMLKLIQGNCLDVMATLPAGCADSVVTDPPYGLSFMGKKWDYDVPSEAIWREALRVLKPGVIFSRSRGRGRSTACAYGSRMPGLRFGT